jgi:HEAT repeats
MRTATLPGMSAFVLIASCLVFGQQQSTTPPPQTSAPPQGQPAQGQPAPEQPAQAPPAQAPPTNPSAPPPTKEPAQPAPAPPPTTLPQPGESGQLATATPKASKNPKAEAWQVLDAACIANRTIGRAMAIRVLGLMPNDAKALGIAEKALADDKPEVRTSAATALGDMKSRSSIPKLKEALDDNDPAVALAAAHALDEMHDESAYEVYYEVLTGLRKAGRGLIASQTAVLRDPKKMALLGFEQGIGFVPFADIGWVAFRTITKDDTSPVRAAAAKVLAKDPDPTVTKALAGAADDKSWLVRAAALEALAKRGDPSVLDTVALHMSDKREAVRYTAAAAVLRLSAIKEVRIKEASAVDKKKTPGKKNNK